MAFQTELKYWESYVSEEGYIAGPDFTLAGASSALIALLKALHFLTHSAL